MPNSTNQAPLHNGFNVFSEDSVLQTLAKDLPQSVVTDLTKLGQWAGSPEALDLARLANDDAGTVVNEEVIADRCTRVNINSRFLMSPFGHHSWNEGNVHFVQFVSQPINCDCLKSRITEDEI